MVTPEPTAPESIEALGWLTSIPEYFGTADIARVEAATRDFRASDYQYGGGVCYEALVTFLSRGRRMLAMAATDGVADRLHVALADLHNLAGWTAFDINRLDSADTHFQRAFTLAQRGHNDGLVANIGYRRGRMHLHHGAPDKALADFQLGLHAARTSGSALAEAILHANQAWASAKLGRADDTLTLLGTSMTDFARANSTKAPAWAAFFDATEMSAMSGVIYTELAQTVDPAYARYAIPALTVAADEYGPGMTRSRSFVLMALATCHFLEDDVERAAAVGAEAIQVAETVRSTRVQDRLLPLKREADRRRNNADARELSERIVAFTARLPGCGWAKSPPAHQPCTPDCATPCITTWRETG